MISNRSSNVVKALKYIVRKRSHALDWDSILYEETKNALISGKIQKEYQISFGDLLLKYGLKDSFSDIRIEERWELERISDLETRFLCAILRGMKAERVFEIGTFQGATTVNFAYNAEEDAIIYTLDLPLALFQTYNLSEIKLGKHIKEHKEISNKIVQLFGDSRKFDFSPYYNKIDLMFIDGDHGYDNVLNDGQKAIACVRNGGFIVWHDFSSQFLGSCKAIIETCKNSGLDLNLIDITALAITKVNK